MNLCQLFGSAVVGLLLCVGCGTEGQPASSPVSTTQVPPPMTVSGWLTPTPSNEDVVTSLAEVAISLTTADPTASLDDLSSFGLMVSNAQIIGLGESTHGTDEFMRMRHRMIRYLIERDALQIVAFEAPVAGIEIVDRYIQGELDDTIVAQEGLSYFTLQNTAVWDLIEWLRTYNAASDESSGVRVVGIDPQQNTILAPGLVLDYIAVAAPEAVGQFRALYADVQDQSGSEHALAQAKMGVDMLVTLRGAAIAASSTVAFEESLHFAEMVVVDQQLLNEQRISPGSLIAVFELREAVMARNVERTVESSDTEAKVVVWGHNNHVRRGAFLQYREVATLGERLQVHYGDAYCVVGLDYAAGAFTARRGTGAHAEIATFLTKPLPSTTYASLFQQLEAPLFLLDLRAIDPTTSAGWWISERRKMWSIGCCYTPLTEDAFYVDLVDAFDVLVFVERTTPTTLLSTTRTGE